MNNDLEQFSEEYLKELINSPADELTIALARISLASKQAKPTFEDWISSRTDTIEVDCSCVTTEAFYHWLKVAYEATPQPAHTEQDGWIKCSERMPDDGESVLTSFRGGVRTAMCKVNNTFGHKMFVDEQTLFNGVPADYWMPLPAAPKPESE